ncbi:MAG: helix-turn-helix domain-containing protein [Candidatus Hydrothermarchaeaceae archaeon]
MIEVVLNLEMPEGCAVKCFEKLPAEVKVLDSKLYEAEGVKSLFEIKSKNCLDRVIDEIQQNPLIYEKDVEKTSKGKAKATLAVKHCFPARSIIEAGFFITSAEMVGGRIEWRLIGRREALKVLSKRLEEPGFDFRIKKVGRVDSDEILTQKEDEIVRGAICRGYFDTPKRAGVRELAKEFCISMSTLSEILRKGQKKILLSYFKDA